MMSKVKTQDYINKLIKENNKNINFTKSNSSLNKALLDNRIKVGKPKKTLVVK